MRTFYFSLLSTSLLCGLLLGGEPTPQPQTPPFEDPHTHPGYLLELAQVHFRYGLTDEGVAVLEKMKETATPDQKFEAARLRSQPLLQKRDIAGAVKVLEPAISALPEGSARAQALLHLANLYQQNNANDAAEKALLEAGKQPQEEQYKKPFAQMVQQQLLQLWSAMPGRLEKETQAAQAALDADPKDDAALERLAEIYTRFSQNPVKAIEIFEKQVALNPSQESQQRLAEAYRNGKQYDKAIELYRKIMSTQPTQQALSSVTQIGYLLLQSGKKDDAVAWMIENFGKPAATIDECNMLGNFYQSALMPEASEETFLKASALGRSPEEKAGILLRIVNSKMQRKEHAKAEELLLKIQADYKEKPAIQTQVKTTLDRLRKLKETAASVPAPAAK
jgi:tetratricopeptide (TPR) repeat protein